MAHFIFGSAFGVQHSCNKPGERLQALFSPQLQDTWDGASGKALALDSAFPLPSAGPLKGVGCFLQALLHRQPAHRI